MNKEIAEKATKLINQFKKELNEQTLNNLSESDFNKLHELIVSAISAERVANARLIEELSGKLKESAAHVELDL